MVYLQYLVLLCLLFSCQYSTVLLLWVSSSFDISKYSPAPLPSSPSYPPPPHTLSYWGSLLPLVSQSIPRPVTFSLLSQPSFLPRLWVYPTLVTCFSQPLKLGLCAHPCAGSSGCWSYLGCPLPWAVITTATVELACLHPLLFLLWVLISQRWPLNVMMFYFPQCCALQSVCLAKVVAPGIILGMRPLSILINDLSYFVTIRGKVPLLQG